MAGKPQIPRLPGEEFKIRYVRLTDSEWEWLRNYHPDGAGAAIRLLKEQIEMVQGAISGSKSKKSSS